MTKEKEATAPIPFPNSVSRMPLDEILVSGNDLKIDEEVADRILKSCIYQGQRPLNEDRALLLGEAIDLAEVCSFAWIAWMSNRQLTLLKILGGKINVRGTPFSEERR